ncbi:hypothetical protein [Nocardioides iriomotensis]|uniref:TfoX N-terminal domain-containing protein n=1 Tax=Nocardioides iriomotensis TaxID=715784 RepID=A0A4Q5J0D7_9ACTN|nr:hypothetical protein [Nocardioides iriomotensis]RYU11980.1 hypothetical protein ETU37_12045 [Nocardioides iriomotensis]
MNLDDVARLATDLDGVRESVRGGRRGWYVDGRLVARQEEPTVLLARCDVAERTRLVEAAPEVFSVAPRMVAHGKVLVDLDAVSEAELAAVLAAARRYSAR